MTAASPFFLPTAFASTSTLHRTLLLCAAIHAAEPLVKIRTYSDFIGHQKHKMSQPALLTRNITNPSRASNVALPTYPQSLRRSSTSRFTCIDLSEPWKKHHHLSVDRRKSTKVAAHFVSVREKLPTDKQEIEVEMREGWSIKGYLTALHRHDIYRSIWLDAALGLLPAFINSMHSTLIWCPSHRLYLLFLPTPPTFSGWILQNSLSWPS